MKAKTKIKIKNMELGTVPRVVGIIDSPIAEARLQSFAGRGVDIFEVRVDLFNKPVDRVINYIDAIKKTIGAPLIGTVRENDLNREDRVAWFALLAGHVDCVDIELGMPGWEDVVELVPKSTVIMVSEHDFKGTPDLAGLDGIVKRALLQKAKIVKIAAMANSSSDVTRLMRFTEDCGTPLVTMSMGDTGASSRVIAPLFGSLFSYGYLRKPLVPGQLSALKIISAMNDYYPSRA